jgi:hypothetical protein
VAREATLKDLMNATVQGRKWLKGADKVAASSYGRADLHLLLIW